jgi:hypothetical protein
MTSYNTCVKTANKKLCARGYCTAKEIFEVYPSAYANGYASSVCQGKQPDFLGETYPDEKYMRGLRGLKQTQQSDLQRWFKEEWVNVCKKGKSAGGYAPCGRAEADLSSSLYPYCRPYYKLPGTTVVTVTELTKQELEGMCKAKRSLPQPSRVLLPKKQIKPTTKPKSISKSRRSQARG